MGDVTPQEAFWAGEFGDAYTRRNEGAQITAGNLALFADMFRGHRRPTSMVELGSNIGNNLRALRLLFPDIEQHAIEINPVAATELRRRIGDDSVTEASILDWAPDRTWDLVLLKGVLIHINPKRLSDVYRTVAAASGRYVALAEYYSPEPVAIPYRGHDDRLFKRDFCREFLAAAPQFSLVDYGFVYRADPSFPLDDLTWFLLERGKGADS